MIHQSTHNPPVSLSHGIAKRTVLQQSKYMKSTDYFIVKKDLCSTVCQLYCIFDLKFLSLACFILLPHFIYWYSSVCFLESLQQAPRTNQVVRGIWCILRVGLSFNSAGAKMQQRFCEHSWYLPFYNIPHSMQENPWSEKLAQVMIKKELWI